MAWRIDEAVIVGEIDNRIRGQVTGRLWLVGRAAPIILELQGNCCRDLAGRLLRFRNPHPQPAELNGFRGWQQGVVGDITASRKVKVPAIPLEQVGRALAAGKPFPWHWANALYLEWFSETNARVVIESARFELTIAGAAGWEMSPEEEAAQRDANAAALQKFLARLHRGVSGLGAAGDQRTPPCGDRLADRIAARLAGEGTAADCERILYEEIDRLRRERERRERGSD